MKEAAASDRTDQPATLQIIQIYRFGNKETVVGLNMRVVCTQLSKNIGKLKKGNKTAKSEGQVLT